MNKELFLKFRDLGASIPGIKLADRDKGQIDQYTDRPGVPFPCLLIKINIPNAKNLTMSGNIQQCKAQVVVRLVHNLISADTSSIASDAAIQQSLDFADLTEAVYNKFQGYTDDEVEDLENISEGDEDRRDGLTVVRMVFNTEFQRYRSGGDQ